jgi:ubiquinone/menaquinone biosynthesis C-methylase UbiE
MTEHYWDARSQDAGLSAVLTHRWSAVQAVQVHRDQQQVLRSALPRHADVAVDLGCGTGRMLPVLAEVGAVVLGVDASAAMLRRAAGHSRVVAGHLQRLPLRNSTVDLAVSVSSLQFVDDGAMAAVARELTRVCRAGARVVLLEGLPASVPTTAPPNGRSPSFGRVADQYETLLGPGFALVREQRITFVADAYQLSVWNRHGGDTTPCG